LRGEALKGHLDLILLATLCSGAAHGYAVIEELNRRSGGTFELPEGTVYPALHRLERNGLLESRWSEESGRRRRVYAVTADGREALKRHREEWRRFSEGVNAVLQEVHERCTV
jgi:DNA-binding PadR family transcriptional regulator